MKTFFKYLVWMLLVIVLFVITIFILFTYTGFSQSQEINKSKTDESNLEKLSLPFRVGFSKREIDFLNSLSAADLEKLIRVIKLIIERNTQNSVNSNSKINSFFSNASNQTPAPSRQNPTTYSNNPSPQTPHYNQSSGQYQSTPPSGSPGRQQQEQNPYSNRLPFSGQPQSDPQQQQPTKPPTPLAALIQGLNRGLQGGGSVDLSNLNVPEFCRIAPNYGGTPAGKCFDMQNTSRQVKEALAFACAAIGKPVPIVSASRNGARCQNAGAKQSEHLNGNAIDFGFLSLDSQDRQKVFEVFKKKGFNGYGCYGANSSDGVHLDHGSPRRWGPDKTGYSWNPTHCPQELFLGGYAR